MAYVYYAAEIVETLDHVPELDGLAYFWQAVIRETLEPVPPFTFSHGPQRIPKKIHYIWLGGQPLSERYKKNIEKWRTCNPDFEIIRWDESNSGWEASSGCCGVVSRSLSLCRLV